jgi:SAM-dependent methyltransferase
VSYAEITFKDKNPIKRYLQKQRLVSAVRLLGKSSIIPSSILDFGAGNGELCKLLAEEYHFSEIICYEPTPSLLSEAKENLNNLEDVIFHNNINDVQSRTIDIIFCLEVFEHLPVEESLNAINSMLRTLKPNGKIVIGVPVEIGLPSLYKGAFRMTRRYGAFDANIKNILSSIMYQPPKERPVAEIAPGFKFYHSHMGFDFRQLKEILERDFKICKISASPFSMIGTWLMPEVYLLAERLS